MALGLLSVPASSAVSERAFSMIVNILETRHRSLSSSAVSSLMVLNSASQDTIKKLVKVIWNPLFLLFSLPSV